MSNQELGGAGGVPPKVARRALVKPIVIVLAVALVVIGGISGFHLFVGRKIAAFMAASASAPQTVSTFTAVSLPWQAETHAVGNVRARQGADLAAQIAGVVDAVRFHSGDTATAGETLLTLRMNDDPAKLAQFEAAARLAAVNYRRDRRQLAAQAISRATVDADLAALQSARAQVAAQRALIAEKVVRAPFAGRLGIRQVDVGQYLAAGTPIVTLQSVDPILIDFFVPQQALAVLRRGQTVDAHVDTYPGQQFLGRVVALNSNVDGASRNVQVRASFPNRDGRLVPGMYADVSVHDGAPHPYVTVPQPAITYNPYGDVVFLVERAGVDAHGKPRLVARQRFVKIGPTRGNQVAVLSGLRAGDTVVSAGQLKLHNGSAIAVNNSVQPSVSPNPTPPNE